MGKKSNVYMKLLNFSIYQKIDKYDFIKVKSINIEKDLSGYVRFFEIINLTLEIDIGKELIEAMTGRIYVRSQLIEDLKVALKPFGQLQLNIVEI